MALMKRLKKFFKTKSNWISIITLVLAFIAICVSFFIEKFSYQVIAIMFSLITVENFIKHFIFIEDIKNKLDYLKKQDSEGIKIIKTNDFIGEKNDFLIKSQKEFIMIGGSMLRFSGSVDLIIRHSQNNNVKVRILALNIENEEIRMQYKEMLNYENVPSNLNHLKDLKNKKNIKIRTYEFLPTAYYFANDLNYQNGIIMVVHILYGLNHEYNYPHILVDGYDKHWYEVYRNQIEMHWEKSTPWQ